MTTYYDRTGAVTTPYTNIFGSALVRLPPLVGSELADWGFSWTVKATDGDPLTAEINGHTYEYLIVDPECLAIRYTYAVGGNGLIVSPDIGAFIVGNGDNLSAGSYAHFLRATNTSTGYSILFFEGRVTILNGAQ
jgi:hypothetical protein